MTQVSLIREDSRSKGAKRTVKVPAIVANGTLQYTKDNEKLRGVIRQFGYFNQITVINNDDVDIEIALDFTEGKTYPVTSASSLSLDEVMYQEFNINNLSGTTAVTANKITLVATYEAPLSRERLKKSILIGGR